MQHTNILGSAKTTANFNSMVTLWLYNTGERQVDDCTTLYLFTVCRAMMCHDDKLLELTNDTSNFESINHKLVLSTSIHTSSCTADYQQ